MTEVGQFLITKNRPRTTYFIKQKIEYSVNLIY